ncbi:MAG TPA: uroporphyrinogen decarboxylase family protein [Candidatus Hydrogenedentes bacterium]|nr:uroporphyrinogen decarboxylase family protein [Candidatus Hydrogenedentota bacterium]HPG69502.1 uroporphyrinogen decarboxylase family protein [Candidatus Hydrogenedentota bacterium]
MAATLTKRERVLRTARFEDVDRIATYDILENDAVIEHYAGEAPTVENGVQVKARAIARCLDMTRMLGGPSEPGVIRNDAGFAWRVERWTSWIVERPWRDFDGFVAWLKTHVRELKRTAPDVDSLRQQAHDYLRRHTDYMAQDADDPNDLPVIALESGVGLTEIYALPGLEYFSILLCTQPDLAEDWFEARNQAELRRVEAIADPELLPVVLTYDDLASKNGPLFSPDWLRTHFTPRLTRLVEAWHAHGALCLFHSDGNLMPILDDLAATGIDGLNPIETCAGMSIREVRRRQPHLFIAGGIDVSQLLPHGTPDDVRARCIEAIAEADGRGFFLGSTTELFPSVPAANAVAMFETPKALAQRDHFCT